MARIDNSNNVLLKDSQLIFRNFSGREDQYNRQGNRNFCILLDDDIAHEMLEDGWNVKQLKPREEGEEGSYYILAAVGYKALPPRIVLISSEGRTNLGEGEIDMLDWAELEKVDIILRPYDWEITNKDGITRGRKAYVKTMYAILAEDPLEREYGDLPPVDVEPIEEEM